MHLKTRQTKYNREKRKPFNMTKKTFSAFALTVAASTIALTANADNFNELPSGEYSLDKTHASVTWQVSHMGLSNYTARFTEIDANVDFNPENIEESIVTAKINPASIRTDYPNADKKDFDKELANGKAWFNAEEHPSIDFKSTEIKMTGENTAVMVGDLTFLGVTKPVTLDVTLNGAMLSHPFKQIPAFGFSARGSIMRSDFGLNTYIPNVGDKVDLIIETEFVKGK